MQNRIENGIRELVEEFNQHGCPCPSLETITSRRQGYIDSVVLAGHSDKVYDEFDIEIEGQQLSIFKPSSEKNLPITIYFHGGCFVSGNKETHLQQLRQLAVLSHSIVVYVDYRLAPENVYPAAHDDVYNAVLTIRAHGSQFGGDTTAISFVGDSAGGQLALITSLRLKERDDWLPQKQILIYPMLDPMGASASYQDNGSQYLITGPMLLSGFNMYTNNAHVNEKELYPLSHAELSQLPHTHIITAEFDPLRDEGELLYSKLLANNVSVSYKQYPGVIHGFFQLSGVSESARQCLKDVGELLKQSND